VSILIITGYCYGPYQPYYKVMSDITIDSASPQDAAPVKKIPDKVRLQRAAKYHGTRALVYLAVFAALDAWLITTDGLLLAQLLSVVAAYLTGSYLAGVFHEWGHFTGARLANAYSPAATKVRGAFMFGFSMTKNTAQQFLSMSIGGPTANWLLVMLVVVMIPIDNIGRIALLATVFARAISVLIFEGPIIRGVMNGGEPQAELDRRIDAGGLDSSQVYGHIILAVAFLTLLLML